jgi:hypothetical protein
MKQNVLETRIQRVSKVSKGHYSVHVTLHTALERRQNSLFSSFFANPNQALVITYQHPRAPYMFPTC